MARYFVLLALAALLPTTVLAQGKGNGKAAARKQVTPAAAVVTTREFLVKHGYQVVRVDTDNGAQVIYYRRGNMGKGKGLGPMERMVVRPRGDIVVFDGGPSVVLVDVRLRLGL